MCTTTTSSQVPHCNKHKRYLVQCTIKDTRKQGTMKKNCQKQIAKISFIGIIKCRLENSYVDMFKIIFSMKNIFTGKKVKNK
jgi:hypothetical protein